MSASMGGVSANRQVLSRPPDKGSFPLDHFNECKEHMTKFLECMRTNDNDHAACKVHTKSYLQCRMDNGLMAKEDLNKFGLDVDVDLEASKEAQKEHLERIGRKYDEGFVAGMARTRR